MKTSTALLALSTALAVGVPSAAAGEGSVVPPSNSAATQYTEAFPTSGGDKKTDQARHRSPAKVLGAKNAHKLDRQGPDGAAAAAAAAATAPTPAAPASSDGETAAATPSRPSQAEQPSNGDGRQKSVSGSKPSGGSQEPAAAEQAGAAARQPVAQPQGASGVGSAIGEATGFSSSGGSGWFLPVILLATAMWATAYLWQQRRRVG